jgi:hypothetical protein
MESNMQTKLTLKLDRNVIDSAKKYAKTNHTSLSNLVENFFKNLTHNNNVHKKYPPLIEKLSGVVSEEDLIRLYQEDEKARHILRKSNE